MQKMTKGFRNKQKEIFLLIQKRTQKKVNEKVKNLLYLEYLLFMEKLIKTVEQEKQHLGANEIKATLPVTTHSFFFFSKKVNVLSSDNLETISRIKIKPKTICNGKENVKNVFYLFFDRRPSFYSSSLFNFCL